MISNGSLITEEVARGMIEAGLDAINISVDAAGKEVFESTRIGLNYDKVIANIERLVRIRAELGKRRPKLILSFVRQNNSADEQAFIEHWRDDRRQDSHHRPAQLGRHAQPRVGRQLSLLPPVADLHGAVGRPRLALLRRLRRPDHPRRPRTRRRSRRSGTPSPIARVRREHLESGGPTSAGPAICRAKTRRSGSPS